MRAFFNGLLGKFGQVLGFAAGLALIGFLLMRFVVSPYLAERSEAILAEQQARIAHLKAELAAIEGEPEQPVAVGAELYDQSLADAREFEPLEPAEPTVPAVAFEEFGRRETGGIQIAYRIGVVMNEGREPTDKELLDYAKQLHSPDHQRTLVHFYLPGQDLNTRSWATCHQLPGESVEVRRLGK